MFRAQGFTKKVVHTGVV